MDEVYLCGPESMMSEVSRGFRSTGLPDSQIHYELFANSPEEARQRLEKAEERLRKYGAEDTSVITMKINGRSTQFNLA